MMAKSSVPFIRTPYNYSMEDVSRETGLQCDDESLAVQSERDDCDINTIVQRFGVTGTLPTGVRMPTYGDFVGVGNFREALDALQAAEESFMAMPAEVRRRFDNDPGAFVDFCSDPANIEEARSLGLAPPLEPDTPLASPQGGPEGGGA